VTKVPPPDLHDEHTQEAIANRLKAATRHSYLGDFVLGAVDGAVTTFAIVAGAAGAGLSNGVVLVLGIANVLADGFSMAAGNFLRARSDQQLLDQMRKAEEQHIDEIPEGEREEVRQIFRAKGFEGDVLEKIVEVITQDRRQWVNTMLTEEWGLRLETPSPWKAAAATFIAFLLAGLIPLIPAVVNLRGHAEVTFFYSSILTGITFFIIGVIRGRVLDGRPLAAGFETFCIGSGAAAVAYFVGLFLEKIAGQ
jgi:VIT1/CCC1 family predicted Fe2+/Mn2+ transporter